MTRKPDDFQRLGDLLKDVRGLPAGNSGAAEPGARRGRQSGGKDIGGAPRQLAFAWPEIVGEEIAANARPVQLRHGRLVVTASSSAWAQSLQLMGDVIIARVNGRLGAGTVDKVVFRHAGWEEGVGRPSTLPAKAGPATNSVGSLAGSTGGPVPGPTVPTVEEETAVVGVRELGLGLELEESIVRAIRASFKRSGGPP